MGKLYLVLLRDLNNLSLPCLFLPPRVNILTPLFYLPTPLSFIPLLFNPATDGLENVVNIVISDQVRVEYVRQMIFWESLFHHKLQYKNNVKKTKYGVEYENNLDLSSLNYRWLSQND